MIKFKSMKWKMMVPILIGVVLLIGGFAMYIYKTTEDSIHNQGEALVESVKLGLEGSILSRQVTEEIMETEMIAQSTLISWIVENGGTHEDLKELAKRGGMDEIWSTDAQGNTTLTSIAPSVDFNFGSDPNGQAYEYMQLLKNPSDAITQLAQIRDVDGKFYKFVGTGSWNSANPKIIQVARNGQRLLDLEAQIGKDFYMNELKTHLNDTVLYASVITKDGEVLAQTEASEVNFDVANFNGTDMTQQATSFNGEKVMNYLVPLSDGHILAITISNKVLTAILIATIIAAIIAVAIVMGITDFTITRQIRRIKSVRDSLDDISNGEADLTKRIELQSRDEIGQLVAASNAVMDNFQKIMLELKERSETIHGTSTQIQGFSSATSMASLEIQCETVGVSNDSKVQLRNIEESSLAMDELARGIQEVTESIMEISTHANNTENNAQSGSDIMNELMKELAHLHEETKISVDRTQHLANLSDKIGEFTNVITGISDQTNLLALNASIEAARAGESGKGFAVVADEVRKLAEESKIAADRIANVVTSVQHETEHIVSAISTTASVLEDGRKIADQAHASFEGIVEGVKQIADLVDILSSSSEEMAASTEEIAASFDDVALLSKQTTGRVENVANFTTEQVNEMTQLNSSVDTLFGVSSELQEITGRYKLK
ncbi:MAG: HAMP domain-containing methyl-accepting chemotaxis protein [Solibacillus sp.]